MIVCGTELSKTTDISTRATITDFGNEFYINVMCVSLPRYMKCVHIALLFVWKIFFLESVTCLNILAANKVDTR